MRVFYVYVSVCACVSVSACVFLQTEEFHWAPAKSQITSALTEISKLGEEEIYLFLNSVGSCKFMIWLKFLL